MEGFVRAKRVTDPLDARVRDRLVGRDCYEFEYASSGSEHSAAEDDSPCLDELVLDFLRENESERSSSPELDSDSEVIDSAAERLESAKSVLCLSSNGNADSYKNLLLAHVSEAVEAFSCFTSCKSAFRRSVMSFLRELGHNAAICKTRWESNGGLTSGNYEFIDVVVQSSSSVGVNRYFIDLDFAADFEIARPSSHYSSLLQTLPRVFVGNVEDVKQIVRTMSDAAKKSLKSRGLHLPPWRKNRYMLNKWFGPYRRTTNLVPESSSSAAITPVAGVKCRWIGFDNVVGDSQVNSRVFVRTR
ncbi:hypothetical protein UlMin_031931 [Ulmus minor]